MFFRFCGALCAVAFQQRAQILAGKAAGHGGHLLRGTLGHDLATGTAALGAKVDDMVGTLDEIQIMLDDDDRIAHVHQLLQHLDQAVHVCNVQACGGFVQNIHRFAGAAAGKLVGQLDALRLAAGQGGGALPQGDIAKTHVQQRLQLAGDLGLVGKEHHRFLHGHVQHIRNGLFLILYFQRFAVVARALAHLAGHIYIRQKVHLDLQNAVALAGFAAAALDVEAEPSRAVAAHLGVLRLGEYGADIVEHAGVGGGVGARGAADGLLIDANDFIHELQPLYPIAFAGAGAGTVQFAGQRLVQDLVDEAGLARTGNAGDTDELPQREADVDVAQVVFPCALHGEEIAVSQDVKGYTAVCVNGITTGFGKASNSRLKNKYPKGLRILR